MANDGPPDGYVTTAEACRRLGISDRTLRRRIGAGEIEAESLPRPQGSVLYVKLPDDVASQAAPDGDATSEPPQAAPEARQDAALLGMLLERLDTKDAALLAATERAARAEAERDAARQTARDLAEQLRITEAQRDAEQRRSWLDKLLGRWLT